MSNGSGRVWGKETAETIGKDNREIINVQRDVIKEQDKGLERLDVLISKQKNIAYQIGNELSEQNKMLDELDNQMDKTSTKLTHTTKRVNKLL